MMRRIRSFKEFLWAVHQGGEGVIASGPASPTCLIQEPGWSHLIQRLRPHTAVLYIKAGAQVSLFPSGQ